MRERSIASSKLLSSQGTRHRDISFIINSHPLIQSPDSSEITQVTIDLLACRESFDIVSNLIDMEYLMCPH